MKKMIKKLRSFDVNNEIKYTKWQRDCLTSFIIGHSKDLFMANNKRSLKSQLKREDKKMGKNCPRLKWKK